MAKIIGQTKRCVRCVKEDATVWGGHVIKANGEHVIAGWCKKCFHTPGFYGHFTKRMGCENA